MTHALVTIGVTCYNAEDTIRRAVRGAMSQDWPALEIIVVDDASTDASAAAVEAEIEGSPVARLVRHGENKGPAGARNTILAQARGAFVAFMDDDDESFPARVSIQIAAIEAHESRTGAALIACYVSGRRVYDNGYTLDLPAIGSQGAEAPNGSAVADYLLFNRRRSGWFYGSGTPTCSLLARRAVFDTLGGFDAGMRRGEDAEFAVRLALKGGHFIGTRDSLFVQYATNAHDKSAERELEAQTYLVEKHKTYLQSVGRYEYAKRWPRLRYWHFKRDYRRFLAEWGGLGHSTPADGPGASSVHRAEAARSRAPHGQAVSQR